VKPSPPLKGCLSQGILELFFSGTILPPPSKVEQLQALQAPVCRAMSTDQRSP